MSSQATQTIHQDIIQTPLQKGSKNNCERSDVSSKYPGSKEQKNQDGQGPTS
jgi:hypothetical protein